MQTPIVPEGRRGSTADKYSGSPLRYPGGKSRAVAQLLPFFPTEPGTLVSPFIGGGSVELALAARGWEVYGYDAFAPLVEFWQSALSDAPALADAVEKYLPLDKPTFYRLQKTEFTTKLERAAAFFVLNRSSFSGSTMSGGMSPGHPRFNASAIDRLRRFRAPNLTVSLTDFREAIAAHPDSWLYADPPYPSSTGLYGTGGDKHAGFDHEGLRDLLGSRNRWLASYGDCELVRKLYAGFDLVPLTWKYGMSADKRSRELLILSNDVAEEWHARAGKELP